MKPRPLTPGRIIGLCLLLSSALVASANLVTYRINMGIQTQLGSFNPAVDRVLVAGEFSTPDWIDPVTTQFVLTNDPGNPDIYLNTFNNDMAPGTFEDHKFIIDVGGMTTALVWESTPNRFFEVTAGDQTLPVVFFNNISNINTLVTTQVTFQVNMGVQIALGNFIPANGDVVYVAGDPLNNWVAGASVLSPDLADTNIYVGTFPITNTVGSLVNYKYIMNTFVGGQQWEINGVGPNGAQNRQFTFTNEATTLPVVYFNNITNASSLVTTQITFKVNLAAQIARGQFDPSIGTVSVAGDAINNWSAILSPLSQTSTNPSVWSGTFDITNTVGSAVNYKFVLNGGGTWENNGVGPGGANDRQLIFANVATVLPDVYFNNLNNLGSLTSGQVTSGQVTVSWTAGPLVRLQTNSAPLGTWVDVPGTVGLGTADVSVGDSPLYFRLTGPW